MQQILAAPKRQGWEILCPMGLRDMEVVEKELDLEKPHDGEDRTIQKWPAWIHSQEPEKMLHMQPDASNSPPLLSPQPHSAKTLEAPQNLDTTQEKGEVPEMTEKTWSD